jgi:hypothetical protein
MDDLDYEVYTDLKWLHPGNRPYEKLTRREIKGVYQFLLQQAALRPVVHPVFERDLTAAEHRLVESSVADAYSYAPGRPVTRSFLECHGVRFSSC